MLTIGGGDAATSTLAIERVLGVKTKELSDDWHAAIRKRVRADVRGRRRRRSQVGRLVDRRRRARRRPERRAGDQPRRPVDRVPLGAQPLLDRSVRRRRATAGKIVRKLTSTATDPHFSSIQFIYSAGAWDADEPADRHRHGDVGPAGARDLRRAERRQASARSPIRERRRDLQSDLGAGRPRDLLHRHEPRPHRSLRLRPDDRRRCDS